MSKVVLVANCCDYVPYEKEALYIGVDKGSFFCIKENIPLICAIGDFDSLTKEQFKELKEYTEIIKLPCEKNETDGEYAIRYAYEQGYNEIEIYGVCGGRQDHFMVMMHLLRYSSIPFKMIDKQNHIYVLEKGKHTISKKEKYVSFFPCENLRITLKGVKYPLQDVAVSPADIYLVSNEIIENECNLDVSGKVIVIESHD